MIEVGDKIRLKDGRIRQLIWIDGINAQWTRPFGEGLLKNIVKHSKNIIDLIEVGDFANGYKIIKINHKDKWIVIQNINEFGENGKKVLLENEIETILTKEQYMQNCYTVERGKNGD